MKSLTKKRAQPLLGTIVEIKTTASNNNIDLNLCIDSAFAVIRKIDDLMSFHKSDSDISRLNRAKVNSWIKVDPWTVEVLQNSLLLTKLSRGVFDISIGRELAKWGLLPSNNVSRSSEYGSDAIVIEDDRVKFLRPLTIDLGGIAKGFAVDKAIADRQAKNISAALINAGGDMRAFGEQSEMVYLRTDQANTYIEALQLKNEALATSATYLSIQNVNGKQVSPLVNGITREPTTTPISVSVKAPCCMVADALTKILISSTSDWSSLLEYFQASVFTLKSTKLAAPLAYV